MNSRERVLRTLRREPTDRLPIDVGGTRQTGIHAFAYDRLRHLLGLGGLFKVFDVYQVLAEIENQVANRLGADCLGLYRPAVAFGYENKDWRPFVLPDGPQVLAPGGFRPVPEADGSLVLVRHGEIIARWPKGGFYFDRYEKYPGAAHPDLDRWDPPRLSGPDLEHFASQAAVLRESTDKAIIAPMGPPYELFNGLGQGGFEDWMITLASEPDYVRTLFHKLTEAWLANLRAFHEAVGDAVQIVQICDDFGGQAGPLLSTGMFQSLIAPYYKRGLEWIHRHTPWKVMLHSDGAIRPLLPAIIEMGVDILNPVQTNAAGMDPVHLKKDFGDRLIFWGGAADPHGALRGGSPKEVVTEAERNLRTLGAGGGYVFASIHNLQADVPAANILALFETALHFRPVWS